MKVTCTVENLRAGIGVADRFTGRHITLPILSYILLTASESGIFITATNLEMGVRIKIAGKIQKPGTIVIPSKHFSQILQSIKDENIILESKQNHVLLHTNSSDITLNSLSPSDFPKIPEIKKENSFTANAARLVSAFQQTTPAAALSDLKPELSGVLISSDNGAVTLAATDSFRLAEKVLVKEVGAKSKTEFIVPARTAQEVMRAMPVDDNSEVCVASGERQVVFEWDDTTVISRLVDGNYPPYKGLIPKVFEATLVVNREDLLKKIKLASVFSSRLSDVTIHFSANQAEVTTSNAETGETISRIPAKSRGKGGPVMFNYRYLLDGLEAAGGESVVLSVNGSTGPAMLQSSGDNSFLYLIMPIRAT